MVSPGLLRVAVGSLLEFFQGQFTGHCILRRLSQKMRAYATFFLKRKSGGKGNTHPSYVGLFRVNGRLDLGISSRNKLILRSLVCISLSLLLDSFR